MTDTLRQGAHRVTYTNSGGALSAGDVVVMGNMIGICVTDIAASTGVGEVEIDGVHELTASLQEAWDQGAQLHWKASPGKLTAAGGANVPAGRAATAKVAYDGATAKVILNNNAVAASAATTAALTTAA